MASIRRPGRPTAIMSRKLHYEHTTKAPGPQKQARVTLPAYQQAKRGPHSALLAFKRITRQIYTNYIHKNVMRRRERGERRSELCNRALGWRHKRGTGETRTFSLRRRASSASVLDAAAAGAEKKSCWVRYATAAPAATPAPKIVYRLSIFTTKRPVSTHPCHHGPLLLGLQCVFRLFSLQQLMRLHYAWRYGLPRPLGPLHKGCCTFFIKFLQTSRSSQLISGHLFSFQKHPFHSRKHAFE